MQTVAASSSLDSHIRIWDLESGKQLKAIDCGPGTVPHLLHINCFLSAVLWIIQCSTVVTIGRSWKGEKECGVGGI